MNGTDIYVSKFNSTGTALLGSTFLGGSANDGVNHTNALVTYNATTCGGTWTLTEYKADKFPIGAFVGENVRQFQNHEIPVQSGDIIYVFSDGYADQFGGVNGKKFKYKPLQNKLIEIHKEPFQLQKLLLEKTLLEWMGNLEQVDDILIIGVKIP